MRRIYVCTGNDIVLRLTAAQQLRANLWVLYHEYGITYAFRYYTVTREVDRQLNMSYTTGWNDYIQNNSL